MKELNNVLNYFHNRPVHSLFMLCPDINFAVFIKNHPNEYRLNTKI